MRAVKRDFSIFPPSFDLMSRRGATLCITSKLGPLNTWIEVYHRVMNTGNVDGISQRVHLDRRSSENGDPGNEATVCKVRAWYPMAVLVWSRYR